MFVYIRKTHRKFPRFAAAAVLVACALVLFLLLDLPVYAAAPAQHDEHNAGMGGDMGSDMSGMGMMGASRSMSGSMGMSEMGAMMVEMGAMMTKMGEMMASMPATGTMSMDDMRMTMGMTMGMMHVSMGMMHMSMGMMGGGMMGGDMMGGDMMGGDMMGGGGMGGGMGAGGMMTPTVTVTATVPGPAATPEPAAEAPVTLTAGAITVGVTPLATDDTLELAFAVTLDTHSVDLSFDLVEHANLTIGTATFTPTAWEPDMPGGHHVTGTLRFVIDEAAHAELSEAGQVVLALHDMDGHDMTLDIHLGAH